MVKLTGWSLPQIAATDARVLDWFLEFDRLEAEYIKEKSKET